MQSVKRQPQSASAKQNIARKNYLSLENNPNLCEMSALRFQPIATAVLPIAGNAAKATANHPSASTAATAVVKPTKPMPMPKKETRPTVEVEEDVYWVPGTWYWIDDDWANGY